MSNSLQIPTRPRSVYPSRLIQRLQNNDDPTNDFDMCYEITTIDSYIKYFLEISGTSTQATDENFNPDFTYAILAVYPTGHGKTILYDLAYNPLFPFQESDLASIDQAIDDYQMTEEIAKNNLRHFVDKYVYSDDFNANEQFNNLLISNLEDNKIKEKEDLIDGLSHDLPND